MTISQAMEVAREQLQRTSCWPRSTRGTNDTVPALRSSLAALMASSPFYGLAHFLDPWCSNPPVRGQSSWSRRRGRRSVEARFTTE